MVTPDKAALRTGLLAARRTVTDDVRDAEASALARHVRGLGTRGSTVCAFAPVGTEPGSVAMLDALLDQGIRVLLPVVRDADVPLRWGEYRPGQLVTARWTLLEPVRPWLPASALTDADVVLVPALAVDRAGVRLGRGGGFYDRSLVLRKPDARLVAVVRDQELLDELPREPHDVLMTHALTPGGGMIALRRRSDGNAPS